MKIFKYIVEGSGFLGLFLLGAVVTGCGPALDDGTDFLDDEADLSEAIQELDSYRTYSGSWAASYATNNYSRGYGTGTTQNPWTDYNWVPNGGNCTNFVSQAIIGGLLNNSSATTAFQSRYDFDSDAGSSYSWYFHSDGDRAPAFTGAHQLYTYAKSNKSTYKGLHFSFVTNDTLQTALNVSLVKVGDVVFADWQHDGTMDHSMIVTAISSSYTGYNQIRLTYQTNNTTNKGLGDLNAQYNKQALFYVYRPVDYNPSGL
ncbi:amidase domain-containing protein [Polyangium sp. 6x1]|uniref:amidase domain-containing protein n=1 Tax=Polyangium sp. 6x1 TaxID=3042689 RepID=UPI002482CBAA|nr:amidase domain-containing protein [Polyangium sp. 6x1]MDI1445774.1 amidase domain-containing protein [Polyangium sp. 6x1]